MQPAFHHKQKTQDVWLQLNVLQCICTRVCCWRLKGKDVPAGAAGLRPYAAALSPAAQLYQLFTWAGWKRLLEIRRSHRCRYSSGGLIQLCTKPLCKACTCSLSESCVWQQPAFVVAERAESGWGSGSWCGVPAGAWTVPSVMSTSGWVSASWWVLHTFGSGYSST